MIEKLYIENVAVIEKGEIEFACGFNILTGETGAGKSIIIDSLSLLLGQRASRNMIRTGSDRAYVSAVFSMKESFAVEKLAEYDITQDEDGMLLIERQFSSDGKGWAKINGRPVSLSVLKDLSVYLVNIHGQHLNQQIMNPANHITYIDGYADNGELLSKYKDMYRQVQAARKELLRLKKLEDDKAERIDILKYRMEEIENAKLREGEEEELTEKRNTAANAEKLSEAFAVSLSLLSDDEESAYENIAQAQAALAKAGQYSSRLNDVSEILKTVMIELEDGISIIHEVSGDMSYSPGQLDEIENRLGEISRLKKKYGGSIESALEELEKAKEEFGELELSEEKIEQQTEEFNRLAAILSSYAGELSASRKAAGIKLSEEIMGKLAFLDMEKCIFVANIAQSDKFTSIGRDDVEFYISANPGEAPKPLARIASGGELSRIMLAIINVLSEREDVDTIIFDEVDAGVSGKTAQKIGVLLKAVSRRAQVLCVTHLAQIAAMADRHLFISKSTDDVKTYTKISILDEAERRRELARIIGGMNITEAALHTADDLISEGKLSIQ